jgi:hypothetical protein
MRAPQCAVVCVARGHVGTLGDLLHGRTLLYPNCNAECCGHHRKIDLGALIAAHGEDMPPQRVWWTGRSVRDAASAASA